MNLLENFHFLAFAAETHLQKWERKQEKPTICMVE